MSRIWVLCLLGLALQGCGGGGGGTATTTTTSTTLPTPITLSGTVAQGADAQGAAVVGATVIVKDAASSQSNDEKTDSNGNYSVDVSGMTPPFLIRVETQPGIFLYGAAAQAGTANVHPLTDMMLRLWYQAQTADVDTAFDDPVSYPAPGATALQMMSWTVEDMVSHWLRQAGVDPSFDLIATPFVVNGLGFTKVLGTLRFDPNDNGADAAQGLLTVDWDGNNNPEQSTGMVIDTTSALQASTTHSYADVVTSSYHDDLSNQTSIIPVDSERQGVVSGINSALEKIRGTVNSKGASLKVADLLTDFDASFKHDGYTKSAEESNLFKDLAGINVDTLQTRRLLSYDSVKGTASVLVKAAFTANGLAVEETVGDVVEGMTFKKQTNGTWRFYGNQRTAKIRLAVLTETDTTQVPSSFLQLQLVAPFNLSSAKLISGEVDNTPYANQTLQLMPVQTNKYNHSVSIYQLLDSDFGTQTDGLVPISFLPIPQSLYQFQIGISQVGYQIGGSSTEPFILSVPSSDLHISDLGTQIPLQWDLPTSFPIDHIELYAHVESAGGICDKESVDDLMEDVIINEAQAVHRVLGTTATSGTITFPTTCGGVDFSTTDTMYVKVIIYGVNGEQVSARVDFTYLG